jgi:hypothetical protein
MYIQRLKSLTKAIRDFDLVANFTMTSKKVASAKGNNLKAY